MSWLDPKFKYRGEATHADPTAFARRMKARIRIANARRNAEAAAAEEALSKVRTLKRGAQ